MASSDVEIRIVGRDEASGPIKGITDSLGGMVGAFAAVQIGTKVFSGLVDGIKGSIDAAMEAQQVTAQTAAVLKSTGDASGQSAAGLQAFADAMSRTTPFSAETIEQGQNMLLTFTNIGKQTFPDATSAITDMTASFQAAGKNMNISDVAILVGKALNDPIKGVTALQRVGVTLSAQQKQQVTDFMAVNDAAGAQRVILGELNREFGGSAVAAGATAAGGLQILHNQLHNVQVAVGDALIPILAKLSSAILPPVVALFEKLPRLVDRVLPVIDGLVSRISGPLTTGMHLLSTVGGGLMDVLGDLFGGKFDAVTARLGTMAESIASGLGNLFRTINWGHVVQSLFYGLSQALRAVASFSGSLAGDLLYFGTYLVQAFAGIFRTINWSQLGAALMEGIGKALMLVQNVGSQAAGFGKSLLASIVADVKSVDWSSVGQAITGKLSGALSAVGGLANTFAPLRQIGDWISSNLAPVLSRIGDIVGTQLGPTFDRLKASLQQTWAVIKDSGVLDQLASTFDSLKVAVAALEPVLIAVAAVVGGVLFEAFNGLLTIFAKVLPVYIGLVVDEIKAFLDVIKTVADIVTGVVKVVTDLIHGQWSQAWIDAKTLVRTAIDDIERTLQDLFTNLGKLLTQIGSWIIDTALPEIATNLEQWGLAFVSWVGPRIIPLLEELGKLEIQMLAWVVTTALPAITEKLGEWGVAFVEWVAPHIADLLIELGKLEIQVAEWIILTALPDIITQLVQWGAAFVSWVGPATTDLLDALPGLAAAVVTWILGQADPAKSGSIAAQMLTTGKAAGKSLVDGILQAVKDTWHNLADWIGQNVIHIPFIGGGQPATPSSSGNPSGHGAGLPGPLEVANGHGPQIIGMAEQTAGSYGFCEQFVGDVMQRVGLRYFRAQTAEAHARMQPLNPGLGPEGAVVFYPWGSEGHVAFSMGDGQHIFGTADTPSGTGEGNGYWAQPYGWTVNPAAQGLFVRNGPALALLNETPGAQGEVALPLPMLRQLLAEVVAASRGPQGGKAGSNVYGNVHVHQQPGASLGQLLGSLR